MKKMATVLAAVAFLLTGIISLSAAAEKKTKTVGGGRYGGTLVVAVAQVVPHLDPDKSTDSYMGGIMDHVYEGLFEANMNFEPTPMLAESYEQTADGKLFHIKLRKGVLFHNGKEMTSADVQASIERWMTNNGGGKRVARYIDSVDAPGPYEITVKFKQPYAPFLGYLSSVTANQKLRIRSKEVIDKYKNEIMEEHIGTGPYQFVEWIPDQHVRLKRFEDYVAVSGPSSAYSGKKEAYADELRFTFVAEPAVRIAGLQTGQYHFTSDAGIDQYSIYQNDPQLQVFLLKYIRNCYLIVNKGCPPFDNLHARQALQHAINVPDLATVTIGDPRFWHLDPSVIRPGNIWHVPNAGENKYNNYNPDKARELMKKAGYDGSPIVVINGRTNQWASRSALGLKHQLEKIGFKVDAKLTDRATGQEIRSKNEGWNLFFANFYSVSPDPQVYGAWMGTNKWIGHWDDEDSKKMDEVFSRMAVETDFDKRYKIVEEWNKLFYDYVPYVKLYLYDSIGVANKALRNYQPFKPDIFFNCWLED